MRVRELLKDLTEEEQRKLFAELLSEFDEDLPQLFQAKELVNDIGSDLVATTPAEGIRQYLEVRELDLADSTLADYERKLRRFETFLDEQGIDDLREVDPQVLLEYRQWRRANAATDGEIHSKTLRDDLYLLRSFIGFLEDMNVVKEGTADSIRIPEAPSRSVSKEDIVDADQMSAILEHLRKYEYATAKHVAIEILAATGCRLGALHSLDVEDFEPGDDGTDDDTDGDDDGPCLEFNHRPPETPLKNGDRGERSVSIPDRLATTIQEYITHQRPDVTDDAGRAPLLASNHGRLAKSTIRRYVYSVTRPCVITGDCPHDRDPATCEAANNHGRMAECPSVQSPHAIRRGYVTQELSNGVLPRILGGHVDMTPEVMETYYDGRDEDEKRELRETIFEEIHDDEEGYYA